MNFGNTNPAGNAGFQLGGGDAPKQIPTFGSMAGAKPTFGVTPASTATGGFGGATSGFSFGSSAAPVSTGFNLTSTASAPSTGFSFSATGGTAGFGATAVSVAPNPAAATPTAAAPSFNVGVPAASSGFSLGAPPASSPVVAPASGTSGFSLSSTTTPAFPLGAAPAVSVAVSAAPAASFSLPVASSAPPATGFNFGASATAPASTGLTLGAATTTSASTGFALGSVATTTPSTSFSLGVTGAALPTATSIAPTTTSTPSFNYLASSSTTTPSFGTVSSSAPSLSFNLGGTSTSATASSATTTTTTTDSTSGGPAASLNFVQLEETINKWNMDLEEQEKLFMLQATQVNAWDRILTSNSEKIEGLNRAVEAVKMEQQRLDNELEFICSQQRELEDCLIPLEKELAGNAVTDPERGHTYDLAAKMDTQLKQMSEDLKEIIENLNERNRAQDSSDPLVQIGRILNSHMDSLQWIEHNTHSIQNHLDQVSKLHESHRRDNERSFHLTYD